MAKKVVKEMKQADLIKAIIASHGTSQAWVGRKIGKTQQAMNRVIKYGNMSTDMLYTIMDALGCEIIIKDSNNDTEYKLVGENLKKGDLEK